MYVVLPNTLIILHKDGTYDYCQHLITVFYICKRFGLVSHYLNALFLALHLVGGNGITKHGKIA